MYFAYYFFVVRPRDKQARKAAELERRLAQEKLDRAKAEEARRFANRLKETTIILTAFNNKGRVKLDWRFAVEPPVGTLEKATIEIYRTQNRTLKNYEDATKSGKLVVSTTDYPAGWEDGSTRRKGGHFYYSCYVVVEGYINPIIAQTTASIRIDGQYYSDMEQMKMEKDYSKLAGDMAEQKIRAARGLSEAGLSEAELLAIEEETGIVTRPLRARETAVRRREQNKRRMEGLEKQHKQLSLDIKVRKEKVYKMIEGKIEAETAFRIAIKEILVDYQDTEIRHELYDAYILELLDHPELSKLKAQDIIAEIDPSYNQGSEEPVYSDDEDEDYIDAEYEETDQ